MGLFVQEIVLGLSDEKYILEKVELPKLTKDKIDLTVSPGTVALISGVKYKGQEMPYKLTRDLVGSKATQTTVMLYPDKMFDVVTVPFFGGQHMVSLSTLNLAKAKFSIVGNASIEVSDYKDLAVFFNCTLTRDELVEKIKQNVRMHLSDEVRTTASKYIKPETTEVDLSATLNDVARSVLNSRITSSKLMNMGLMISPRGISMHVNALDDAEETMKAINIALADKAISSLDNDILDREERETAAARQHEIDLIRARNTDINESVNTRNVNTNGKVGNVVINDSPAPAGEQGERKFCPYCGAKLVTSGKFCPECGKNI